MPKQKTRKIILKRFKITKTGKVKRAHSRTSHRNRIDDGSTKRRKGRVADVYKAFAKKIKLMVIS